MKTFNLIILFNLIFNIFIINNVSIASTDTSYFLHVTDIHYDIHYDPGSPNNCIIGTKTGMGCCRKDELPLDPYYSCSKWGDFNCDNPTYLNERIFSWIANSTRTKEGIPPLDFIIYTGDSPGHHLPSQSVERNIECMYNISQIIDHYFPKIPLYQSLGNHDTYPIDQTMDITYDRILANASSVWSKWLSVEALRNARIGGYYSVKLNFLGNGIRLISFNSIYYDKDNLFGIKNDTAEKKSGYQWLWLEGELEKIKENNEKFIFINHIPPGTHEANDYYNGRLINLLAKYQEYIIVQLYGHTHEDRFMLHKVNNNYTGYTLIPGSLMTAHHDPSFRIYAYDKNNKMIKDYRQYSCSLRDTIKSDKVLCNNTYNFTTEYKMNSLSLNSMIKLYNQIKTNSSDTAIKYIKHYYPGANHTACDTQCLKNYVDEIVVSV